LLKDLGLKSSKVNKVIEVALQRNTQQRYRRCCYHKCR